VAVADRDGAARLADLPAEANLALQDVTAAIKDGLMAFCCSAGLAVVAQLMEAEMTDKVGPKGRHDPERPATRNGSAPGRSCSGPPGNWRRARAGICRSPIKLTGSPAEVPFCAWR